METTLWTIFLVAVLLVIFAKVIGAPRRAIVFEFQRGLRYSKGRFRQILQPGAYWIFPRSTVITLVDVRPVLVTIPTQEIISSDGVTLKISLAAEYDVIDASVAINSSANYQQAFYLVLQMAVRQLISAEKVEAIIEQRATLSERITALTGAKIAALGLRLISAEVKDVMLPGELRRTFAQVVKAQKEGQAALERARGETASLRSLANAAKMVEDNPNLLHLRALQLMAESTGNTIMLGVQPGVVTPPRKNGNAASST